MFVKITYADGLMVKFIDLHSITEVLLYRGMDKTEMISISTANGGWSGKKSCVKDCEKLEKYMYDNLLGAKNE